MSRPDYDLILRADVIGDTAEILAAIERTEDRVWLSRTVVCDRANLIGVPARLLDVLIDRDLGRPVVSRRTGEALDVPSMVELGTKRGRYDGAERTRITLRRRGVGMQPTAAPVSVDVEMTDACARVRLVQGDGVARWEATYDRLRWRRDEDLPLGRILRWHWSRYFRHLDEATVEELARGFAAVDGESLTAANRRASRALYEASRVAGWRKLTIRERMRYGLGEGQWRRDEEVIDAMARYRGESPTGCGEHTLRAARPVDPREHQRARAR